jgi:predicted cupin superfamily sugar epimerase
MKEDFTPEEIIRELGMEPHVEGGYYTETYHSPMKITLPDVRQRHICTAIYYMMRDNDISHMHRIASDETWLFHQGCSVEIVIVENGAMRIERLSNDLANGDRPQVVVPAHAWFGARLRSGAGHALVSCVVSPGFDPADFQLATTSDLRDLPCFEQIRGLVK